MQDFVFGHSEGNRGVKPRVSGNIHADGRQAEK